MTDSIADRLITVDDVTLHVRDRGQGQAIVLIQPGLLSADVFEGLANRLAERFRVITLDSRGHGQSTNPSGELGYDIIADDVAKLIAAMGLDKPFVGGWSDGGEASLQFGARHPGVARGLIAGGTSLAMYEGEQIRHDMRQFFQANEQNVVDFEAFAHYHRDWLHPQLTSLHTQHEHHWQEVAQQSAEMWITYTGLTPEEYAQVQDPTLVVLGDRDDAQPIESVVGLYRKLPNAELAIMPRRNHMDPVFESDELAGIIAAFIDRTSAKET